MTDFKRATTSMEVKYEYSKAPYRVWKSKLYIANKQSIHCIVSRINLTKSLWKAAKAVMRCLKVTKELYLH